MSVHVSCRQRRLGGEGLLCNSPKFVDPPNRVTLSFCAGCWYREPIGSEETFSLLETIANDRRVSLHASERPPLPAMFCITCSQTPERLMPAREHFRLRNLDVQFFPGIHGRSFGLRTTLEAYPGYRMPAGHVGLLLTHYMLWQTLLYLPYEEVLILEDDVIFEPDFVERFQEAYAELPDDWQIVYVGAVALEGKEIQPVTSRIGIVHYPCGTHAYLVKRSTLPLLLQANHQARNHVDLQLIENSLPDLRFYVFTPPLVRQHSCEGNWPTTTAVPDDPVTDITSTGAWIGTGDHGHHFDASLAQALINLFRGHTVVDLGCGKGDYVRSLTGAGIFCEGYDGNPDTPIFHPDGRVVDLSACVELPNTYDWVLSLEVGEHIPTEFEEVFLDNLHRHNRKGIVLSWAIPGQGGHDHVNERENDYIRDQLLARGYSRDEEREHHLRSAARLPWFKNTLMVFRKR